MPSNIGWTDESWNPITGCTKISPGCANCYAEVITLKFNYGPAFLPGVTEIKLHDDRMKKPTTWRKPRMIFVNSMSDMWHDEVPDAFLDTMFAIMSITPQHTYQILTKRPDRMYEYVTSKDVSERVAELLTLAFVMNCGHSAESGLAASYQRTGAVPWPLPNVWLGVSTENQYWADKRIPVLLRTPAAVRFISAEPLLKAIDLKPAFDPFWNVDDMTKTMLGQGLFNSDQADSMKRRTLDWVIVGGESGKGHRPMNVGWAKDIAGQCVAFGVPIFMKQDSGSRSGRQGRLPDDLWQMKEFPVKVEA